ncbi:sigma-54-dependent Fis family transcriptional regulator [Leptospira biflexa]|uniref:Putative nitrogen assimilation regulatory protein NtrX n=1 Tax=Leptospira biflexa serovar Patoc (strain Patoc 1 / ATCC 23582 / Paris) TaxID=456481 RepID=B0SR60_LEPBP|nr:sigma-54 dependent transcriptional regulator [Leptospira biflexa]ABZ94112.1 Response regulator of a two component response regulator [Leptospira biflexa serovar Patoc strain 'Patoc 1 (Ames)']ABZ97761.1 Putative nitrogen assimilation regulatory protein NtrX [Leptospira biflexa serovar Patoc strain 'Patoc 1 (Paris)']TGM38923.1 sigma-54-dependent Fis family transcriptional regulator [Leptospira biflexa]TGM39924.1 sigma-54-dependent Fis family transcriptional regulator [Leptospira biflexa]TGM48
MQKLIYILDDEKEIRKTLRVILEDEEYSVEDFSSGKSLIKALTKERPSLVLLDVWVGKEDGLTILDECKKLYPSLPIVMISGHGTIELAVNATKKGAVDFLEKPLSIEKVIQTIESSIEKTKEVHFPNFKLDVDEILGVSPSITRVKFAVFQAAETNARVFIYGENGTGKELTARAIHQNSKRKNEPYIEFNCASLPEESLEQELFGLELASQTDSPEIRIGKWEQAQNGTLFLDEICDLSLALQSKVLKVILDQKLERVGGKEFIPVDVRIIAATNSNVEDAIREGKFREDLFYALNVIPLELPPLRERNQDIPLLAEYYLKKSISENHLSQKTIDRDGLDALSSHFWPGNVRELTNIIERLSILVPGDTIKAKDVKEALHGFKRANEMVARGDLKHAKEEFERQYIIKTLQICEGNVTRTSKALGIERTHLYRKLRSLNISVDQLIEG